MVCSIVASSTCYCRPKNARGSRTFHVTRAVGSTKSDDATSSRRVGLVALAGGAAALLQLKRPGSSEAEPDRTGYVPMEALKDKDYGKTPMKYKDYVMTESGLQYQDLKMGQGQAVTRGQEVLIDWDGYTVGYYGRVFEARNKPKGSSFSGDDKEFFRFRLGDEKVIAAINEAVEGMRVGGIRRLIVPESLGYVGGDWRKWGPSPTTFAGKRTLDFVLQNRGMIDKTLLMDVEIIKAY